MAEREGFERAYKRSVIQYPQSAFRAHTAPVYRFPKVPILRTLTIHRHYCIVRCLCHQ